VGTSRFAAATSFVVVSIVVAATRFAGATRHLVTRHDLSHVIDVLPDHSDEYLRALGPQPDDVLAEMDEYADEHGFPHVGPAVGGWLELLARSVGAERVFEFGSGYGYSAYWFSRALPDDGEVVLTEIDEDELDLAREYLDRGGHAESAHFELGDAMETIEDYEGPFDVVLIDHQKHRYRDAFEAVREKVAPGGLVIADNVMGGGSIQFEALLRAWRDGASLEGTHEMTRGIDAYLRTVRDAPDFETGILPLGEGISVSHRQR